MSDERRHKCEVTDRDLSPCWVLEQATQGDNAKSRYGLLKLWLPQKGISGVSLCSGKWSKGIGIILNYCPFCGADIGSQFKAEGEEAAS